MDILELIDRELQRVHQLYMDGYIHDEQFIDLCQDLYDKIKPIDTEIKI